MGKQQKGGIAREALKSTFHDMLQDHYDYFLLVHRFDKLLEACRVHGKSAHYKEISRYQKHSAVAEQPQACWDIIYYIKTHHIILYSSIVYCIVS